MQSVLTFADVLVRQAQAFPDRRLYTFLADGETESGTLSYGDLDSLARRVAHQLLQYAIPGDRAMLLYPVGLDYLAAFFGCLYAGVIAVPAYPVKAEHRASGRIRAMIADCTPRLVLTCTRLAANVKGALENFDQPSALPVLCTDTPESTITRLGLPAVNIDSGDVAFLQYTSASISEPKGVRVTHGNLLANEEMIREIMGHDEHSTFISWLPPYHDMGLIGNLLHPLYLGSSCVFMPPSAFVQKPARWLSAISKYQARTSGAPTFAYDLCVKKVLPAQMEGLDLKSWTVAYCGAEMVDTEVARRFAKRYASCGFRQYSFCPVYGLAEATLLVSGTHPHEPAPTLEADCDRLEYGILSECPAGQGRKIASCGSAAPGTSIVIADPERCTANADRVIGEIWVSGRHIADGYWNNPGLSREIFSGHVPGRPESFLRTGDLGAMVDGQLYVVGRMKEVIIHQGRNIHPTDIERIVERAAGESIESCAAFVIPGDGTEEIGIVCETGRRPANGEIKDTGNIGESIAWEIYRLLDVWPARIAFANKGGIPHTSSGKKQRLLCSRLLLSGALPVVAEWQAAEATSTTDTEADGQYEWLAKLISRFTGLPLETIVDGSDGAASWGLDSLRTLQIIHQIERRTGAYLPVSLFYENASFASIVGEIGRGAVKPAEPAKKESLPGQEASAEVEITRGQEAIWFSQQLNPESPAFHLSWALQIAGTLDCDRLRDAVRAVIARHDVLRYTFQLSSEGKVQGHATAAGAVDYEFLAASDETILGWIDRECSRPFNPENDLLIRVRHGRGSTGDFIAFCLHHLVTDLWSCALLTEQVLDQYVTGEPVERAWPYHLYTHHIRDAEMNGGVHKDYWRSRLEDAGAIDPVDVLASPVTRPSMRRYEGDSITATFSKAESGMLLDNARTLHVSKQMLMLAVYGAWMWSATELENFLTGCVSSGRSRALFSRMQGLFSNPFAVRFQLNGGTIFSDLLGSVREQVLAALEHEDYPFSAVVNEVRPHRDLGRTPLFQNMFVYQQLPESPKFSACILGNARPPFTHRGLEVRCVPLPKRSARYDLTLYCLDIEDQLTCELVYNTALFSKTQMAELLGRFEGLLLRLPLKPYEVIARELTEQPARAVSFNNFT